MSGNQKDGIKRRSKNDIKSELISKRSKFYYERKKLKLKIEGGNLSDSVIKKTFSKILKIDSKIDKINIKVFKYGKRWEKLKSKKRILISESNKLLKKIESESISEKERKNSVKKLLSVTSELNDLNQVMEMKLGLGEKGEVKIIGDQFKNSIIDTETIGFWEFENVVMDIINYDVYKTIYIDDIAYDVKTQSFEIHQIAKKISSGITEERASGKRLGTPSIVIESNLRERIVKIYTGF